jgi:polyphenol oxidase
MSEEHPALLERKLREHGLDWIVPVWPVAAHVQGLVTTRAGGVSRGPYATMNLGRHTADDAECVAENRRRLAAFLPSPPVWLNQVHGAEVAVLGAGTVAAPKPADAAVTRERGVVCAVLVADCLPVLLADRRGSVVGVAHAGWRGLAAGVLEATVTAIGEIGAPPGDLVAWLGPAIGPAAFEVGADVRDTLLARDAALARCFVPQRDGKWLADLYGIARNRLAAAGVTQVSGGGDCTKTDAARFFSYRRERASGRMAALAWLAQETAHV